VNRHSEDRRRAPRFNRPEEHGVTTVRVRPGRDVSVVDVSVGGLLVEMVSRLLPGSPIDLQLQCRGRPVAVRGLVQRCVVTKVRASAITYRGAIQFEQSLPQLAENPLLLRHAADDDGKPPARTGTEYPA
jgi:hypothetical protein